MSQFSTLSLPKQRSQTNFGLMSPQSSNRNMSRNSHLGSARFTNIDTSSRASSSLFATHRRISPKALPIPMNEMFKSRAKVHSGTILPEHLYHPPKSSACMTRSPSNVFPKSKNQSFINKVVAHSKQVPAPSAYNKPMRWLNNTARDLGKGSKRKTIIDEIYIEKKKIPGPNAYKNMIKERIIGSKFSKTQGFDFMSETEYLGNSSPSSATYKINEDVTRRRSSSYRIVKPKGNKMHWKPVKSPDPAVGQYNTDCALVVKKSPNTKIGKDKVRSIIEYIANKKKKIPAAGDYDIIPCYDKIYRPMKTSR